MRLRGSARREVLTVERPQRGHRDRSAFALLHHADDERQGFRERALGGEHEVPADVGEREQVRARRRGPLECGAHETARFGDEHERGGRRAGDFETEHGKPRQRDRRARRGSLEAEMTRERAVARRYRDVRSSGASASDATR